MYIESIGLSIKALWWKLFTGNCRNLNCDVLQEDYIFSLLLVVIHWSSFDPRILIKHTWKEEKEATHLPVDISALIPYGHFLLQR